MMDRTFRLNLAVILCLDLCISMMMMRVTHAATLPTVDASLRRVDMPVIKSAPSIDGQLDDACWQTGVWQSGFAVLNKPSQLATHQTTFQWATDQANLYLAVRVDEPDMQQIQVTQHGRDSQPYADDSIELMLAPNADGSVYYHWCFNSADGWYDAQVIEAGRSKIKRWDANVQFKTQRHTKGWTLELAIPLADLGLEQQMQHTWRFNVMRNRYVDKPSTHSSFSPMLGGFHDPSRFAYMNVSHLDLKPYQWQLQGPVQPEVVQTSKGLRYRLQMVLLNQTQAFRFLRFESQLDEGEVQKQTAGIAPGQAHVFDVDLPVEKQGRTLLQACVLDRGSDSLWYNWQSLVDVHYTSPLRIELSQPAYRNNVYASQHLSELKGSVQLSLPKTDQPRQVQLQLLDASGQIVASQPLTTNASTMSFDISMPEATGKYTLKASVIGQQSSETPIAPVHLTVNKLAPAEMEFWLDEHGVTHRNAEPFLPFGWFSVDDDPAGIREAVAAGCNVAMDYNNYYRTEQQQQAFLDRMYQAGMQVLSYPYPKREMNLAPAWQRPLSSEEAKAIRAYISRWKSHPAIMAWYMADEPELRPALVQRADAIYDIVRDEDPYHPCIMLNDTRDGIRDYHRGGDVMMPDPYPHFLVDGHSAKPMNYVARFVREVAQLPVMRGSWLTPQAFNYADFGRVNNREPNETELRNMMYQGIIAGSTGFVWYSHKESRNYPKVIAGVNRLAGEAAMLKAAILSPQLHQAVAIAPDNKSILASLRHVGSSWYLIAVNVEPQAIEAQMSLPNDAPSQWQVFREQRTITATAGHLHDRFGPYEAHVYYVSDDVVDDLIVP